MQSNSSFRTFVYITASMSLVACANQDRILQPADAPVPSSADTTFVDANGCSWWVIGNATSLSWAPMTDASGEHVCDEGRTRIAPPQSQVPAPAAISATPIEDAVPMNAPALEAEIAAPTTPASSAGIVVQVASFKEAANANASVALFENMGLPTSAPPQGGESNLYRLMLGPFASRDEADRALSRAKAEGFGDAFIVN